MAGEATEARNALGTVGKWVGRGALLFAFCLAADAVLPGASPIVQQVADVGADLTGTHYAQMIPAGLGKATSLIGDGFHWGTEKFISMGTPSL